MSNYIFISVTKGNFTLGRHMVNITLCNLTVTLVNLTLVTHVL